MEQIPQAHSHKNLSHEFQVLSQAEILNQAEIPAFLHLEEVLRESGFNLGDTSEVLRVLYDEELICRSESFTKVTELLVEGAPIPLDNEDKHANMCIMASGAGFKTAMQEGFSGKDVGGVVKVVVSFKGEHLSSRSQIGREDSLWETKRETAQLSLVGEGEIHREDVEMVSFRFPVKYFPESQLTEDEKDMFEENAVHFIVRHYVPERKRTVH
jgi:hypothetical protein